MSNPFKNQKGTLYAKDQKAIRKLNKVKTKPKAKNKTKKFATKLKKVDLPFQPPKVIRAAKQLKTSEIKTSKGESIIADWLRKHNVSFVPEKKFNDLVCPYTNNHLRFDFYLVKLKMIIEFDGIQHFKYCKQFDGLDKTLVLRRQQRDRLKYRYCQYRGIKMLRIKYTQIKNIEAILCKNCL